MLSFKDSKFKYSGDESSEENNLELSTLNDEDYDWTENVHQSKFSSTKRNRYQK